MTVMLSKQIAKEVKINGGTNEKFGSSTRDCSTEE
jgi:hypothetical protein